MGAVITKNSELLAPAFDLSNAPATRYPTGPEMF
jgi:hypothetical protein